MKISIVSTVASLVFASAVQGIALEKRDLLNDLQAKAFENLKSVEQEQQDGNPLEKRRGCSIFNAAVRKDW